MGGAAIMQYLAYATTTEDIARRRSAYGLSNSPAVRPGGAEIDYELDYRIASVTTVDSPLNQVDDREAIGQLLAKYTRVKTTWSDVGESQETALTIDGSDLVNHVPINNIRKDPNETWSGPCMPCWPHSQHTTQVGNDTRAFLERVWK